MFDWLGDIISTIVDSIKEAIEVMGNNIANTIWTALLRWLYETVYDAVADFFTYIDNMGAELFELEWVKATVELFTLFGWGLFAAGTIVAVFDFAIEYQNGRANIKSTALNIIKGFVACSLVGIVPVELFKFCINLQNTFSHDLVSVAGGTIHENFGDLCSLTFSTAFPSLLLSTQSVLLTTLIIIAFAYCVVKAFFNNIKRGGILLVQLAVGSLYMFSIPRGYQDGFNQWCKQIIALCLTSFMQTTLLMLGMITFPDHMILGLGVMLAANEVPRIAQQFGLDSSVKVNMMSVVHATSTAVNLTRTVQKVISK